MTLTRRMLLGYGAAGIGLGLAGLPTGALAQEGELTIAYNVNLPSFDPTVGPSAVNPTIQGIYQSIFDQYINQNPDLSFTPGLLTEWGWTDDNTKIRMVVRDGVKWHDGSDFTAEDVVWSLERAGKEETGNPIQFVWSTVGNFQIDGNVITADVLSYDPTLFKWMGFLTGYVLPKKYYEEVGAERLRAEADRHRPLHGRQVRAQRLPPAEGQPRLLGRRPSLRDRDAEIRDRRLLPRGRGRIRRIRHHAGDPLRGVRPAQGQGRGSRA